MKKIVLALIMIVAVLLTACSSTYKIDELVIDSEKYPGWDATLRKREGHDYLDVRFNDYGREKSEPMQKMTYMVFKSSSEAKKYYRYWIDYCDDSSELYEKGNNWFITRLPDTYDVVITAMFYRDKNVIICAEVNITTYSTIGDSHTTNNAGLRPYVMGNHADIRRSVMKLFE